MQPDCNPAYQTLSNLQTNIGNNYICLNRIVAKTLDDKYPLAATLARRAMIHFALTKAKTKRYKYVARHIRECAASAAQFYR